MSGEHATLENLNQTETENLVLPSYNLYNRTLNLHELVAPPPPYTPNPPDPPSYSSTLGGETNSDSDYSVSANSSISSRTSENPYQIFPDPPPSYADSLNVYYENVEQPSNFNQLDEPPILGATSVAIVCPLCGSWTSTKIRTHSTQKTHMAAFLLFTCGCWLCCLFPYCMSIFKDTKHYCSACGAFIGVYAPV